MTDPMPVFTIKAKDRLALAAVCAYRDLCTQHGLTGQVHEVNRAILEMQLWRERNPDLLKTPDHAHVPAGEGG